MIIIDFSCNLFVIMPVVDSTSGVNIPFSVGIFLSALLSSLGPLGDGCD